MKYKNYIWDFDGTLYDTYPVMVKAFSQALDDFGLHMTEKDIYQVMKKESLRYLIQSFQVNHELLDEKFHQYEIKHLEDSLPFEETKSTLETILKQGGQHFILSHRHLDTAHELLEREGLEALITETIGADSNFPRKPKPDSILYLVEKYRLEPDETLMIGDRKLDVEAGRNAGVKTCLFDIDGFLGKIEANHVVGSLAEIPQLHDY